MAESLVISVFHGLDNIARHEAAGVVLVVIIIVNGNIFLPKEVEERAVGSQTTESIDLGNVLNGKVAWG